MLFNFSQSLQKNSRNLKLWMLLIDRYRQMGDYNSALEVARRAFRLFPENVDVRATIKNLTLALLIAPKVLDALQKKQKVEADEHVEEKLL